MNAHRDPPFTYKFVAITADNAHEAQPFTGAELVLLDGRLAAWCSVRLCARCAYQMHVREKRFTHTQYEHMEACVMSDSAEWHYERL